jgi:hypothetical protein
MTRRDSEQWVAAKSRGDSAELAIAAWFRERGFEPYKTLGLAPFDLLLQCLVEVKHDLQAVVTGNVAIETHHRGQPSGILTSRATYWAIVVGAEAFVVETKELRDLALVGNCREVQAGDHRAATVRLLLLDKLRIKNFVRVIELPEFVDATA